MKRLATYFIILCVFASTAASARTESQLKAETLYLQALELYHKGEVKLAGDLLDKAAELDPSNDAVHYYRGYVAAAANDASGALKRFSTAYGLDSTNVWYAMRLAHLCSLTGQEDRADSLYSALRKARPGDTGIMSSLVEVYLRESKYAEADSLLSMIERVEGHNDYVDVTRIELARQKGDYASLFNRLDGYFSRPEVPAGLKRDMMDRMLNGSDPRFNYIHLQDYERLLTTCLSVHPADTAITHLAGGFYYATQKNEKLFSLCSKHPDDVKIMVLAATACFAMGDYDESIEYGKKILSLSSDDLDMVINALNLIGDSHFCLENYNESFKAYEKILKLRPGYVPALNNYAYYLSVIGQSLPKAARMSRKTIDAEPENATYLDTYAWILYQQKKYKAAQSVFKKAMVYGGKDSPEILRHYAATLDALGQNALAEGYRQQAVVKENGRKN